MFENTLILLVVYKTANNLTNLEMSKKFDVNYSTMNRWLSGECHIPPRQAERLTKVITSEMGDMKFFVLPGWLSPTSRWAIVNIIAGDYRHALQRNETVFYAQHACEITFKDIFSFLQHLSVLASPSGDTEALSGKE
ncbi:MAG: hypothetical protein IJS37_00325 [Bacilli bacterium]|nr:hypothetical protein [Bacilli bacterium]